MPKKVLLDTSFFIRFLNDKDPLFANCVEYYKYFLSKEINLVISTISISEFCVGGKIEQLPLKNLQVLPFNVNHAVRSGEFARYFYEERKFGNLIVADRRQVSNDAKLFAQTDTEQFITSFVTSDTDSIKLYHTISKKTTINFELLDINQRFSDYFGVLDFEN